MSEIRPDAVLRALLAAGHRAYYVGGCVRDMVTLFAIVESLPQKPVRAH